MSIPQKMSIQCPKCGVPIIITRWDSINTEMRFAADDVISGKLFEVTCVKCGYKTNVDYPMLFNDMEHGIMIMYQRPNNQRDNGKLDSLWKSLDINYRIVSSQEALREKVCIINAGFDDHVIELYKTLVMLGEFAARHPDERGTAYFIQQGSNYAFQILTDEENSYYCPFSKDVYKQIEFIFNQCQKQEAVNEAIIDDCWAEIYLDNILGPYMEVNMTL